MAGQPLHAHTQLSEKKHEMKATIVLRPMIILHMVYIAKMVRNILPLSIEHGHLI